MRSFIACNLACSLCVDKHIYVYIILVRFVVVLNGPVLRPEFRE